MLFFVRTCTVLVLCVHYIINSSYINLPIISVDKDLHNVEEMWETVVADVQIYVCKGTHQTSTKVLRRDVSWLLAKFALFATTLIQCSACVHRCVDLYNKQYYCC